MKTKFAVQALCVLGTLTLSTIANAGDAFVTVGRFANPPPRPSPPPIIVVDPPPYYSPPPDSPPSDDEPYPSVFRLQLGPVAATTGRGMAAGGGIAIDIGRGPVGLRFGAVWTGSETQSATGPLGGGFGQYTGEVYFDFFRRGPWHPVVAFGFGLLHVNRDGYGSDTGVGTARIGLDYAIVMRDVDIRLGLGVTGGVSQLDFEGGTKLGGYVMPGALFTVGF